MTNAEDDVLHMLYVYISTHYLFMMEEDASFYAEQMRSSRQLNLDWRVLTVEELADRADFVTKTVIETYRGDMGIIQAMKAQFTPLSEWHTESFSPSSLTSYAAILVTLGDDQTEFTALLKECVCGRIKVTPDHH